MAGQGRTLALVLIALGLVVILVVTLYLLSGVAEGRLRLSGFLLGLGLTLVLALPLLGGGILLLLRSRSEIREFADVEKQQKILNMVLTRGRVDIADVGIELNLTREQVREKIYDLVGKQLFTGYVNWEEGVLYARDAAEMRTTKCPNCGGVREMVGKGIVKCPYCGSDLFL